AWGDDVMKLEGLKCQKQKKVKTNSASTCGIRVFSILRTRRSPLRSAWQCRFSLNEATDPGVKLQRNSGRRPPKDAKRRQNALLVGSHSAREVLGLSLRSLKSPLPIYGKGPGVRLRATPVASEGGRWLGALERVEEGGDSAFEVEFAGQFDPFAI